MTEFEEEGRNWKWLLIPIVIIGGIGLTLGYQYLKTNQIDLSLPNIEQTTTTPIEMYTATGTKVFDGNVESIKIINLNAGRYNLVFDSDDDVIVSLRKNPNGFFICCNTNNPKASGVHKFDVNSGADGDYELKVSGTNPTSHVTISQELAF